MMKAEIHRILQNPIYTGDFRWHGKLFHGSHQPLISQETFAAVQGCAKSKAASALSEATPRLQWFYSRPRVAAVR
jgi:Recombinase